MNVKSSDTRRLWDDDAWIDTDDSDAIAWGNQLFERYRAEATQLY